MDHTSRDLDSFEIGSNRVPETQFDPPRGFGWAFEIVDRITGRRAFRLVIKSFGGESTSANIDEGLRIGQALVDSRIQSGEFQPNGYYCYQWEPDGPDAMPATERDCREISPGHFRSP
jgi:hypothetical protein